MKLKGSKIILTSIFILIIGSIVGLMSFSKVQAAHFETKEAGTIVIDDEVVEEDLYLSARSIVIDSDVEGDIFAVAQDIEINGNINGKVIAAGNIIVINGDVDKMVLSFCQKLDINGTIGRSLYFGAAFIDVQGEIMEDIYGAGATINIEEKVYQDVYLAGRVVNLKNKVSEDVFVAGDKVGLLSDIEGNAYIAATRLRGDNTRVSGDLNLYTEEGIDVPSSINVQGNKNVEFIEQSRKMRDKFNVSRKLIPISGVGFMVRVVFKLVNALGLIFLGFIALKFMPVKINDSLNKLRESNEILKSLGVGFVSIPLGMLVCLVLMLSVIGWPLLKVLLALATIAWIIAIPMVGIVIGERLWILIDEDQQINYMRNLFVGVSCIQLISILPILGGLIRLVLILAGIGAMLRMLWDKKMAI